MQIWNNVIDLDFLSPEDETETDINHYEADKVCVNKILIMHNDPSIEECPF